MADTDKGNPGFASDNYPKDKAQEARSKGGKESSGGAAGKTEAAKRGGQNSHGGGNNS